VVDFGDGGWDRLGGEAGRVGEDRGARFDSRRVVDLDEFFEAGRGVLGRATGGYPDYGWGWGTYPGRSV
jgi:hypothetical protein